MIVSHVDERVVLRKVVKVETVYFTSMHYSEIY